MFNNVNGKKKNDAHIIILYGKCSEAKQDFFVQDHFDSRYINRTRDKTQKDYI